MSTSKREPIYNSLSLSIPTIAILTTIIIHTLYSYVQQRTKFNKGLTFTALLSISTFLLFSCILLYLSIREMTQTLTASDCILYFLKDSLMITGKIFMYLFFIARLFFVFRTSLFSYDRKQILRYISATCIFLFIPALLATSAVISPIHSVINKPYNIQTQYHCSDIFQAHLSSTTRIVFISGIALFTLFDIIISIIILRAFISRLLWLYTWCAKNQTNDNNSFLLQAAMKTFNLTAAAITTSWFGIVFNASGHGSHWLCIDITVNALAMYLSFSFSSFIYDKLSMCCCTNCCFVGWRKLCYCCCLTFEIPKDIETDTGIQIEPQSKQQVFDTSIAVSMDETIQTNKTPNDPIENGENVLNNGMKVVLHAYKNNESKPSLAAKLSNLSNSIKNKMQKKSSEKLISLQHAQSEPVPKRDPEPILLQNHFSNQIV